MKSEMRQSVVEYLLGELPTDQLERLEADLLEDPDLMAEVDRLRPVVTRLEGRPAGSWEPIEPPPLDIAAIVAADTDGRLAESPVEAGRSSSKSPRRSLGERFGFAWPRAAAVAFSGLLILAVGIGVGTQLGGDGSTSGEPVQTLALDRIGNEVPDGASGEVLLTGDAGDQVTLDVSGLEQTGEREYYELWLLGDGDEIVSLGSFRVPAGGNSQVEVPLPVNPERYRYFDVSIEPENGSADHSGRSVLRGLTAS